MINEDSVNVLEQPIKILYNKLSEIGSVGIFDYKQFMDIVQMIKSELIVYTVQDIALVSGPEEDINLLKKLLLH